MLIMPYRLETGRGNKISNPTWQQISDAILEMDGTHSKEVELELENVGSMLIGGGDQGRYLVVYFPAEDPDTLSVTLTDLDLTGPDVQLTVQTPAKYPARVAVRLPLVLQAVEQFYRSGELPRDVYWEPS
jgi:Immunity protein Imm1